MDRRKLVIGLLVALALSAGAGASVLPSSADGGIAIITLASGKKVQVVASIPCSATPIPPQPEPIISIDCPPQAPIPVATPAPAPTPTTPASTPTTPTTTAPTTTTPTTTTPTTTTPTTTTPTTTTPKPKPQPKPKPEPKPEGGGDLVIGGKQVEGAKPAPERPSAPITQPTAPTTTPAPAAGASGNEIFGSTAPVGVPNFFIEKFRIPPFLLGIYQAAGIEYGVPWQVLAAINEIETDYGRNLNVSSAGALGWMQFMPSSWETYGVDANGDGRKDPYNPVDAIFAAARYLKAAGAATDLRQSIFAYNHADWYVDSVMLRARLIGGLPADLVGALTGLTSGRFPVAAKAQYTDGITVAQASRRVRQGNAAQPVESSAGRTAIDIYAKAGSPVIAVQDGVIRKVGETKALGKFVVMQDVYGNTYTYSHLGKVASSYPSPKTEDVTAAQVKAELKLPKADPKPEIPASAGSQPTPKAVAAAKRGAAKPKTAARPAITVAKERLFAHPARARSRSAGGDQQLVALGKPVAGYETYDAYFKQVLGLKRADVELKPLKAGAQVIGGTVLGRIDRVDTPAPTPAGQTPAAKPATAKADGPTERTHVTFQIRPVGRGAPLIDPKPILDGWRLLESTAIYRAAGTSPFFGAGSKNPTIGQIMLMSKETLEQRVLADPNIDIYECGRRDIRTGQIDRRVLATLAYLSASGLKPTVSALKCGHSYLTTAGTVSEHSSGNAVDIALINGIPIYGHQGKGTITDITIRRLLNLQGTMKPHQIISLMTFAGADNTLSLSDHDDHIHVGFYPRLSDSGKLGSQANAVLKPGQWTKLIDRLGQIDNPVVSVKPSKYSLKVTPADQAKSTSGD